MTERQWVSFLTFGFISLCSLSPYMRKRIKTKKGSIPRISVSILAPLKIHTGLPSCRCYFQRRCRLYSLLPSTLSPTDQNTISLAKAHLSSPALSWPPCKDTQVCPSTRGPRLGVSTPIFLPVLPHAGSFGCCTSAHTEPSTWHICPYLPTTPVPSDPGQSNFFRATFLENLGQSWL